MLGVPGQMLVPVPFHQISAGKRTHGTLCLQDSGRWKDPSVFKIIAITYTIPLVVEQRKLEGPSCLQSRGCSIYLAAGPHVVC
jgi:hypothetical protein